ncbi:conserved hypothetical protein [Candidatus Nitrotoga sp. HW29]|nr:conserved hypothetical protein [Candidatus Nitrotoga sp. HW29]
MLTLLENQEMKSSQNLQDIPQPHNRRRTDRLKDETIVTRDYKQLDPPNDARKSPIFRRTEDGYGIDEHRFNIRLADTEKHVGSASLLVQKMYATRGYPANPIKSGPQMFTLVAYYGDKPVGTVTLTLDSEQGLAADQLYKENIDKLRAEKLRVCELTKLAIDRHSGSKFIFGSLLHVAYIYAKRIYDYTDVVLEVVPHHLDYYVKMLGCEVCGEEKLNPRVNFPVNLLRLSGSYMDEMIKTYGGLGAKADTRSLYAYFFSKIDEEGIMQRLLRND